MRPMLNPGLRRVWRDPRTVQFGVDVRRPMILAGVDDGTAELLRRLDGALDWPSFIATAVADGYQADQVEALLQRLNVMNLLTDAATWPGGAALTAAARQRLAPDLAAAAADVVPSGPAGRCQRLADATVTIAGVGRVGAVIATLLTASGIGRINLLDDADVHAADVCVGGFTPEDVGRPRTELGLRLRRWLSATPGDPATHLTIVTDAVDARIVSQRLVGAATPHLLVSSAESIGRIGPFVLPGVSCCLRCFDLERSDLDPGWPQVAAQLRADGPAMARDSNLSVNTAAVAALHVTSWLAGGRPTSINGVVELRLPHGDAVRRPVPYHPSCGCAWPTQTPQETMVG